MLKPGQEQSAQVCRLSVRVWVCVLRVCGCVRACVRVCVSALFETREEQKARLRMFVRVSVGVRAEKQRTVW